MRSSKSRSRSKSNRPRTLGNITNRVFDSSGPEGKVRGTPQQIIDKYLILARDAQLSNDRVNAENFLQHAEHYTRMLGEAMREMQAEQDQRRQQESQNQQNQQRDYPQRERQQDRGDAQQPDLREDRSDAPRDDKRDDRRDDRRDDNRREDRRDHNVRSETAGAVSEVIENQPGDDDTGLVETPETRRPPRHRPVRNKAHPADAGQPDAQPAAAPVAAPVAADEAEKPARKPRGPRKPKQKPEGTADQAGNEAAE